MFVYIRMIYKNQPTTDDLHKISISFAAAPLKDQLQEMSKHKDRLDGSSYRRTPNVKSLQKLETKSKYKRSHGYVELCIYDGYVPAWNATM